MDALIQNILEVVIHPLKPEYLNETANNRLTSFIKSIVEDRVSRARYSVDEELKRVPDAPRHWLLNVVVDKAVADTSITIVDEVYSTPRKTNTMFRPHQKVVNQIDDLMMKYCEETILDN